MSIFSSKHTYIPNQSTFLYFLKCRLLLHCPWGGGGISIPHKLGFSENSPPQLLLPSNLQILMLMLITYLLLFLLSLYFIVCGKNKIIKALSSLPILPLNLGQTIATFEHIISQHCWPNICKLWPNNRNIWAQHITLWRRVATCWVLIIERAHAWAQHCCTDLQVWSSQ